MSGRVIESEECWKGRNSCYLHLPTQQKLKRMLLSIQGVFVGQRDESKVDYLPSRLKLHKLLS